MGLIATTMACLAMSCGGPPAAAETTAAQQPFAIRFEKSGGLKPMPQQLTIRPGRHAVASMASGTGKTRTVRFRVSRKKVATLKRGLARARFGKLGSSPTGNCADCYLYTIDYRGHEVMTDQSTLSPALADVVTKLETLVFVHVVMPSPGELPHLPFH